MTDDQYRQLVEFLTRQFTQIDGRFAQVDARFVDVRREISAVKQELGAEIQQLSERVDWRFAEFHEQVQGQFDEVKGLIRVAYTDLDRRVRRREDR